MTSLNSGTTKMSGS